MGNWSRVAEGREAGWVKALESNLPFHLHLPLLPSFFANTPFLFANKIKGTLSALRLEDFHFYLVELLMVPKISRLE